MTMSNTHRYGHLLVAVTQSGLELLVTSPEVNDQKSRLSWGWPVGLPVMIGMFCTCAVQGGPLATCDF